MMGDGDAMGRRKINGVVWWLVGAVGGWGEMASETSCDAHKFLCDAHNSFLCAHNFFVSSQKRSHFSFVSSQNKNVSKLGNSGKHIFTQKILTKITRQNFFRFVAAMGFNSRYATYKKISPIT